MLKNYFEYITHEKFEQIRKENPKLGNYKQGEQRIFEIPGDIFSKDPVTIIKNPQLTDLKDCAPRGIATPTGVYMIKGNQNGFIHYQIIKYMKINNIDMAINSYHDEVVFDEYFNKFLTIWYDKNKNMFQFGESYSNIFKCLFEKRKAYNYEQMTYADIWISSKLLIAMGINTRDLEPEEDTEGTINIIRKHKNNVLPVINNLIRGIETKTGIKFDKTFSTASYDEYMAAGKK